MAIYNKFDQFVEDLAHSVHKLDTETLRVALSNAANAPVDTNTIRGNLIEIAYTNVVGGVNPTITTNTSGQALGIYTLNLNDLTITAGGGPVAGFRYVNIYNDTPTAPADPLICWFDYGSDLVLADGESLTVDFESDGAGNGDLFTLV